MPHTSTHNYLHIVFGTKERASSIPDSVQPKLWAYLPRGGKFVPAIAQRRRREMS